MKYFKYTNVSVI